MSMGQVSFTAGEISPLLHARVDLAKYATGLAELRNMIVLPQGGVTRRGGFTECLSVDASPVRYIPFEYNSTDNMLLEFRPYKLKVYWGDAGNVIGSADIATKYSASALEGLRYVQSGNVMFLVHRDYAPMMLTRESLTEWRLQEIGYRGGPFIDGSEWNADAEIRLEGTGDTRTLRSQNAGIFRSEMKGVLMKLEYAVPPKTVEIKSEPSPLSEMTSPLEVKGTLNVMTAGDWIGTVTVQRSGDGGVSWVTIRQYVRTDYDKQGQWDFTVSEAEAGILYRVTASHVTDEYPIGDDYPIWAADKVSKEAAQVTITASGFLKSEIYKLTAITSSNVATCKRENTLGYALNDEFSGRVSLWSIGAWGEIQGYPGAVCLYQDRLILAGTKRQPQTIWMSRTGDYADFSTSDPLKDDDAVTLTLAAKDADGIHSLVSGSDLLAFTVSGEWKLRGSGDSGAITPSALTAHQQSSIGTKDIQPLEAGGRIILVQAQGQKIYALGYDLNTDGYVGSEISIMSAHMFEGKNITGMVYQKTPDGILWFVLSDGTLAACTFNPEHEIIGWSRHDSEYKFESLTGLTGKSQTEIYAVMTRSGTRSLKVMNARTDTTRLTDSGSNYVSEMRTLRLNADNDAGTARLLIARISVSTLKSSEAWCAPGGLKDRARNWERRRKLRFDNTEYLTETDIELDNGFSDDACIHIRSVDGEALTVAGITPVVTIGGR